MNDRGKSPCFHCPDRKENGICHSTCEQYLDFVERKNADTAKLKAWKKAYKFGVVRSGMHDKQFEQRRNRNKNRVFKNHKK